MKKNKVRVWKKGYWRMLKAGNRVWIKGRYNEKELQFPSFTNIRTIKR